jgi:hypothetical protein
MNLSANLEQRLRVLAERKHKPYQTLLKEFVLERVLRGRKTLGHPRGWSVKTGLDAEMVLFSCPVAHDLPQRHDFTHVIGIVDSQTGQDIPHGLSWIHLEIQSLG